MEQLKLTLQCPELGLESALLQAHPVLLSPLPRPVQDHSWDPVAEDSSRELRFLLLYGMLFVS